MARGGVNKAVVQTARMALLARGEHPSIDAVRIEMGNTGSKTTIHRYLKELDDAEQRHSAPQPAIGDELTELVSRLAQRLQEQAEETIEQAQATFEAKQTLLQQALAATQLKLDELETRFVEQSAELHTRIAELDTTRQALHTEHTLTARLAQAQQDLELRLQDKDGYIRSLEEKHLHARDALEHYRHSIKDQREQEQRRHEGQLQQVQMEVRQAQQSAMVRQEEITQLNRDNERLLSETRSALRELSTRQDQLNKAVSETVAANQLHQQAHTQCALLQERLNTAHSETGQLKQTLAEQQSAQQALQLELIKAQLALENLRTAPDEIPDA
ncbi:MAG: Integrase [Pseudomonas sp.]|nr:Integrase [Pseudomonas sp.]